MNDCDVPRDTAWKSPGETPIGLNQHAQEQVTGTPTWNAATVNVITSDKSICPLGERSAAAVAVKRLNHFP